MHPVGLPRAPAGVASDQNVAGARVAHPVRTNVIPDECAGVFAVGIDLLHQGDASPTILAATSPLIVPQSRRPPIRTTVRTSVPGAGPSQPPGADFGNTPSWEWDFAPEHQSAAEKSSHQNTPLWRRESLSSEGKATDERLPERRDNTLVRRDNPCDGCFGRLVLTNAGNSW